MKRTRWKNITICIVLIVMLLCMTPFNSMGIVIDEFEEPTYDPNHPHATPTPTPKYEKIKLYLVCASKNSTIYEEDKKSKLFTVGEGDSLLMINSMSDSNWTCIFVDGFNPAYIKTSSLVKNQNNTIQKKKLIPPKYHGEMCLFSWDNSVYIYSGANKGKKIGVLRGRVSLPYLPDDANRQKYNYSAKVATFSGVGYVYTDINKTVYHCIEDLNWFEMYD